MTIPEDAVQTVAQMLYDWNIERPTTRDVIAAYQEWMRSTGHVPDHMEFVADELWGTTDDGYDVGAWFGGPPYRVRP